MFQQGKILSLDQSIRKSPLRNVGIGTEQFNVKGNRVVNGTSRPRGYKTFFMLNSTEDEIFLLVNVKMPTI